MNINFKEKLNGLLINILAVIFILGIIILYAGLKNNLLFVGIGAIIVLPFLIWFLILYLRKRKIDSEIDIEIQKLKKYGEKVIVNLENIKIRSNSWREEIRQTSQYEDGVSHVDIDYNVIELEIPYKGEFIHYDLNIIMESTKLKMHFAIKRETILYVDLRDRNKNYLDLEFLE